VMSSVPDQRGRRAFHISYPTSVASGPSDGPRGTQRLSPLCLSAGDWREMTARFVRCGRAGGGYCPMPPDNLKREGKDEDVPRDLVYRASSPRRGSPS
jgi:hypothetical protein